MIPGVEVGAPQCHYLNGEWVTSLSPVVSMSAIGLANSVVSSMSSGAIMTTEMSRAIMFVMSVVVAVSGIMVAMPIIVVAMPEMVVLGRPIIMMVVAAEVQ